MHGDAVPLETFPQLLCLRRDPLKPTAMFVYLETSWDLRLLF